MLWLPINTYACISRPLIKILYQTSVRVDEIIWPCNTEIVLIPSSPLVIVLLWCHICSEPHD